MRNIALKLLLISTLFLAGCQQHTYENSNPVGNLEYNPNSSKIVFTNAYRHSYTQ
jgi:uncharacterized lipoprotein YajG